MRIIIDIETHNAAFDEDKNYELWRILTTFTDTVPHHGPGYQVLLDSNGNTVGTVKVES